jgi:cytochrome c5
LVVGSIAILAAVLGYRQAAGPQRQPANAGAQAVAQRPPTGAAAVAANKAVLDEYCVTCHNDRAKTANLSLQNLDFANIQNMDAELWERVVRKLRSGIMPPAGIRRPPEDQYAALRDFMEAQLDRKAAAAPNSGSIVLHRLNRAEYANVVRDLLAVEIDPALFLPTDDSANGFDNVAGSLTISPTLLEAYTSAAARIARMAVGYWRSPTEPSILRRAILPNQHVEGLPPSTRVE